MKRIVAWVNKWDKKQLEKYHEIDIYFSSSIEDFEFNLKGDIVPLLSLKLAGKSKKKIIQIIKNHSYLKFYYLGPRYPMWVVSVTDMDLRDFDNTEVFVISHSEAARLSLYPDQPLCLHRSLGTPQEKHPVVS